MPAIKSTSASANKWARRAGAAAQDYTAGVRNPRRSWSQATGDSKDAWEAGVQAAAARGAFEKGVSEAGDQKWQQKSVELGSGRYSQGVAAAQDDYQRGFEPFARVIEGVTLPPRGPKGSPQNYQRTQAIGEALHKAKTGGAA